MRMSNPHNLAIWSIGVYCDLIVNQGSNCNPVAITVYIDSMRVSIDKSVREAAEVNSIPFLVEVLDMRGCSISPSLPTRFRKGIRAGRILQL